MSTFFEKKFDDWDFLIVLDACRFDFFSHYYNNFFTGTLTKISSSGSCTREWFVNGFKEYFEDVIYVSANPYINSFHAESGFDIKKRFFKLDAKNHFYKVIDVWSFGWDNKLGTVHPETLTQIALSLRKQYPEKRLIIHYLQPHAPYISDKFFSRGFPKPNIHDGQILTGLAKTNPKITNIFRNLTFILEKVNFSLGLGNLYIFKLKELLFLPPIDPLDATLRLRGVNGLRRAYAENVKTVLSHIAYLASKLSGNIIITSDHGEFLGENRRFGHPCGNYDPIVRKVPWFKITSVKRHLGPKQILRYKIADLKRTRKLPVIKPKT